VIGKTLLHYTVLEKIGEGGMGVVYKGRDTQLDRFVALKVLPRDRATDQDHERRFIQEAKAASALNHANIVTIHQIGTSGDVTFIAMEFVDGHTLAEIIPRQGLPIARALNYAVQMADGLATAHKAGIVHRDLKPGNIMVGHDGRMKILDFGLAKLAEAAPLSPEGETRISDRTGPGVIVGTVAYMSPEQADARPVDQRSDIFSFGVVLYEMVTGRRPFGGDTPLQTLSAILRDTPPRVAEVAPGCPPELERVIERCLRKDPERRWQHMQDVRVALMDLKDESDSGRLSGPTPAGAIVARKRTWWPYAAAAAVLVAGAAAVWVGRTPDAPVAAGDLLVVPLTTYPGDERDPAFSPDGTQLAFSWAPDDGVANTYVKLVGPGDPIRLTTSTRGERMSQWSPDGRWIVLARRGVGPLNEFVVIPALGGPERVVATSTSPYAYWTPDSESLAVVDDNSGALMLASLQSGDKRRIIGPLDGRHVMSGRISPDGTLLAVTFVVGRTEQLYVAPLADGHTVNGPLRPLTPPHWILASLNWMPDSREVIFARVITGSNLGGTTAIYRVSVDGGDPRRLDFAGDNPWFLDIAQRGHRLAYTRLQRDVNLYLADLNAVSGLKSAGVAFASSSRRDINPVFSPDASRVAFSSDRGGTTEIWTAGRDGRNLVQLTHSAHGGESVDTDWPRWSPSGTEIAYSSQALGVHTTDIFIAQAGGGTPRRVTDDGSNDTAPSWSRDGQWLYFLSDRDGTLRVWRMPVSGGPAVQLSKTRAVLAPPMASPDGQWVYFRSAGIVRVPAVGGDTQVIVDDARVTAYATTDLGLLYLSAAETLVSATLRLVPSAGGPARILGTIPQRVMGAMSLSPDGKALLYSRCDRCEADILLVENFRWLSAERLQQVDVARVRVEQSDEDPALVRGHGKAAGAKAGRLRQGG